MLFRSKSGDADKAEQLANQHIVNAYNNMIQNGLYEIYGQEKTEQAEAES